MTVEDSAQVPVKTLGDDKLSGSSAPKESVAGQVKPDSSSEKISIDDFLKIDLRVAKIVSAERVSSSRKLIKLEVQLAEEVRTLVAGIAESYLAESLVGRTIVVVANLKPAKLMGIESNGMLLAAGSGNELPRLVGFDNPPSPGTRVR